MKHHNAEIELLDLKEKLRVIKEQRDNLLTACKNHKKITIESYGNTHWDANYKEIEEAIIFSAKNNLRK